MMSKTNSNIMYLYILRVIMYIFPLLTLPILLRRLGIENYGVISLIQAVSNYFILLVNYGFNFTGSRDVAKYSHDSNKLNEIFNNILFTKLFIVIVSSPVVIILGLLIPTLRENFTSFLLIFVVILNEVFFPIFLYQGMENMKMITFLNLLSRVIGLIFISIFVRDKNDLFLAIVIINLSTFLGGFIGLLIALKKYSLKIRLIKFSNIIYELRNGWNLFIAQGMTAMFSNSSILILGIILSPKMVGYYSVAEKIMRMAASFVSPISNAMYPVVVKKFVHSSQEAFKFIGHYFIFGTLIFGIGGVFLFSFSDLIITIFNGEKTVQMSNNLRILSFIPLSIFVNNIYGTQIQLQISREKSFRNIILFCGLLLPLLTVLFVNINSNYGAAFALLISEVLLTILMVFDVEKTCKTGFFKFVFERKV